MAIPDDDYAKMKPRPKRISLAAATLLIISIFIFSESGETKISSEEEKIPIINKIIVGDKTGKPNHWIVLKNGEKYRVSPLFYCGSHVGDKVVVKTTTKRRKPLLYRETISEKRYLVE